MAPEQLDPEGRVDARVDQFAFGVALYEALFGVRPFSDDETVDDARRAERKPLPTPARSDVPAWLTAAVLRCLEQDPERRWPDMSALLEALGRDPDAARRRLWTGLAGGALVIAAGAATFGLEHGRRATCERAGAPMAQVWNGGVRERLRGLFSRSGSLAAGDELERAGGALDAYARAWAAMSEEACRASRIDGRQSDTLYDLRMACLDERRQTTGALLSQWQGGMSAAAVQRAAQAVAELPPLDACADAAALTAVAPLPRDKAARVRIAEARQEIDRARALDASANLDAARTTAQKAADDAAATGWPEVQAEAQLALGQVLDRFDGAKPLPHLMEATRLATVAHDDELAARAFVAVVSRRVAETSKTDEALALADAAEAFIARAGEQPTLRGRLLLARGLAYQQVTRHAEAVQAFLAAQPLLAAEGPLHDDNIKLLNWLTDANMEWGHYAEAEKWGRKALAAQVAASGPSHPRVSETMLDLSNVYCSRGDYAQCRQLLEQALALDEKIYGPETPHGAAIIGNLCYLDIIDGAQLRAAEKLCRHALDIYRRNHEDDAWELRDLGVLARMQGQLDQAVELLRQVLVVEGKTSGRHGLTLLELGRTLAAKHDFAGAEAMLQRAATDMATSDDPRQAVEVHLAQADLLRARGRCGVAVALYQGVARDSERLYAADYPDVGRALAGQGMCAVDESRFAAALAPLGRALDIFVARNVSARERGEARLALARAQAATGDGAAARASGERAVTELAASEEALARALLSRARAWLSRR
jgi:tetratricopeptide (TPR) repeat protein